MSLSKRRLLALTVVFAAVLAVQCAEKEGPINPYVDSEPPPYIIASLSVNPQSVEPGEHATVTALLTDRGGEPVADHEIIFTTTLGTIESPVTTDQDGLAVAIYTAPGTTGTGEITAVAEGAAPQKVAVQAGQGMLSASPASILADGISTSTLSVVLVDGDGEPAAGVAVAFSTTLGTLAVPSATTDGDGYASTVLVSFSSIADVVASVTADFTLDGVHRTELALVEFRGISVSVSADPAKMPADGLSVASITAWVRETTAGAPLSDVEVSFRTSAGAISGSSETDGTGLAEAYLTSSTVPGVATVKAVYGGIADSTAVTFGTLVLSAAAGHPKMIADGVSSQYVVATLVTDSNNPVGGVVVDFSTDLGSVARSAVTDGYGRAAALLVSSSSTGTAKVVASFKGVYKDTVNVSFENPVLVLRASPLWVTAKPSNSISVYAYVHFSDGSPVQDTSLVRFTTTQGVIASTASTSSGIAVAQLRPNGLADDMVVVTGRCGKTSQTAQVIFSPDAPARVVCTATPTTIADDGIAFSTLIAEVTDSYGNHVEDGSLVTFSVTDGHGVVTPSGLTSSGVATARFTATLGGAAEVRAACDQAAAYAGITVTSGAPGSIIAEPDTGWIAVGGSQSHKQALITARVLDSHMSPVADGTPVSFEIEYGPGGGEYLDDPGLGYGPVAKATTGGIATAVLNSGTTPGTVVVAVRSGSVVATAAKVGISAGAPDHIFVTSNTNDIKITPGCLYSVDVSAIVRDQFNNPVENGTAVYFTLDNANVGAITPEVVTGGVSPCQEFSITPHKGVTHACIVFTSAAVTLPVGITASCGTISSTYETSIPIPLPVKWGIAADPGAISGAAGGTVMVFGHLYDDCNNPLAGVCLSFSVDGAGQIAADYDFGETDQSGFFYTYLEILPGTPAGKTSVSVKLCEFEPQTEIEITIY